MILHEKSHSAIAQRVSASSANTIGAILVAAGKLTPVQVEQVLRSQKDVGLLFGDAAIRLGFVRPQDVEQALACQFEHPYLVPGQNRISRDVVAAYNPFSAEADLFRAVRSRLLTKWFGAQVDRRAIAIASPERGDGRSYVAANLAVVFSQLGERTLLIDADMRNPRQHMLFGINNGVGLSSILSGRAGVDAIEKVEDLVNLSLLPAGPIPPNPGDLVARASFSRQMDELIKVYDVVVVDTPAATSGNDAYSIAHRARGALIVARKDKSRFDIVQRITEHFRGDGVEVLGAVLNDL
jgi:chain length determinant protein tyrosine kinase EpsG